MSDGAPIEQAAGRGPKPPAPLILAGAIVLLEGLGILVITGWLAIGIIRDPPVSPITAWAATLLLGLFGIGVVVTGRGVLRVSRRSRAPAAVTQLLVLAIGSQLGTAVAVALFVGLSVVAGVMLFLPRSTAAFAPPEPVSDDDDDVDRGRACRRRARGADRARAGRTVPHDGEAHHATPAAEAVVGPPAQGQAARRPHLSVRRGSIRAPG